VERGEGNDVGTLGERLAVGTLISTELGCGWLRMGLPGEGLRMKIGRQRLRPEEHPGV
jgi:hypothetical protein